MDKATKAEEILNPIINRVKFDYLLIYHDIVDTLRNMSEDEVKQIIQACQWVNKDNWCVTYDIAPMIKLLAESELEKRVLSE
jgi:hypothetical protein